MTPFDEENMKTVIFTALLFTVALSPAAQDNLTVLAAKDAKWVDAPGLPAGVKACPMHGDPKTGPTIAQVKVPAGTVIAPHTHPGAECTTILSGKCVMGQGETVDESKGKPMEAGDYVVIPAQCPHWFKATTDVVAVRYSNGPAETTYCNEKDDPRKK
jgi:quercetin dioxygenase-like cupin family protein